MTKFILTKSKYIQFLQCPKSLWLLEKSKVNKSLLSSFDQLKISEGIQVGKLATTHPFFCNGTLISTLDIVDALAETKRLLKDPAIKTIYEAAFMVTYKNQECFIRVDILQKNDDGSINLIEVKSASKAKDEYFADIAFQKWVIEQSKLPVKKCFLMMVNNHYIFNQKIELLDYFIISDVDDKIVPFLSVIPQNVAYCHEIFKLTKEPIYPTGTHCSRPHHCDFYDYCNNFPQNSIENLRNLHYKKKQLLTEQNIKQISDIPESLIETLQLTNIQKIQIACAKNPENFHLESANVDTYLKTLKYPLHFLDFEALLSAIPYFDGMKPQQFVVYQASIHKQTKANKKLEHSIYLHSDSSNPKLSILNFLKQNISKEGSIIVYHKQFEETQLSNLKRDCPEYSNLIDNWISRLWDLEKIFSNFWFYDSQQQGSTSIKKILPTLVPRISYKSLSIRDGNSSVANYLKLIKEPLNNKEKHFIIEKLNEYNTLDTYAMVKILNKIKWILKQEKFKANHNLNIQE